MVLRRLRPSSLATTLLGTLWLLTAAWAQDPGIVSEVKITSKPASPFTLTRRMTIRSTQEHYVPVPAQPDGRGGSLRGAMDDVDRQLSDQGYVYAETRERNGRRARVYQREREVGSVTFVVEFRARSGLRRRGEVVAVQMQIEHTRIDVQAARFIPEYPSDRHQAQIDRARQRVLDEVTNQVFEARHELTAKQTRALSEATRPITLPRRIPVALPETAPHYVVVTISATPRAPR
jgi:hypothetical protein